MERFATKSGAVSYIYSAAERALTESAGDPRATAVAKRRPRRCRPRGRTPRARRDARRPTGAEGCAESLHGWCAGACRGVRRGNIEGLWRDGGGSRRKCERLGNIEGLCVNVCSSSVPLSIYI